MNAPRSASEHRRVAARLVALLAFISPVRVTDVSASIQTALDTAVGGSGAAR